MKKPLACIQAVSNIQDNAHRNAQRCELDVQGGKVREQTRGNGDNHVIESVPEGEAFHIRKFINGTTLYGIHLIWKAYMPGNSAGHDMRLQKRIGDPDGEIVRTNDEQLYPSRV